MRQKVRKVSLMILSSLNRTVLVLEKRPRLVLAAALVFGMVWRWWGAAAAIFWGTAALMVFLGMSMRPVLSIALVVLAAIPFLYLLDRPAQAERAGVLVFVLLALAALVNVTYVWQSLRPKARSKMVL